MDPNSSKKRKFDQSSNKEDRNTSNSKRQKLESKDASLNTINFQNVGAKDEKDVKIKEQISEINKKENSNKIKVKNNKEDAIVKNPQSDKKQVKTNSLKALLKAMIMLKRLYPSHSSTQISKLDIFSSEIIRQRPYYKLNTLLQDIQILEKLKVINIAQIMAPTSESNRLSVIHVDVISRSIPIEFDDEIPKDLNDTLLYKALNDPIEKVEAKSLLQSPRKDIISTVDQNNFKIFRYYKDLEVVCLHSFLALQSISKTSSQNSSRIPLIDLLALIASGHEDHPREQQILKQILDLSNEVPSFIQLHFLTKSGSDEYIKGKVYLKEEASISSLLQRPLNDLHILSSMISDKESDKESSSSDSIEAPLNKDLSNSTNILSFKPQELVAEIFLHNFHSSQKFIRKRKEEHLSKSHL